MNNLADELILLILSFASVESIGRVAQVSKNLNRVSNDQLLWKELVKRDLNFNVGQLHRLVGWKIVYQRYKIEFCITFISLLNTKVLTWGSAQNGRLGRQTRARGTEPQWKPSEIADSNGTTPIWTNSVIQCVCGGW